MNVDILRACCVPIARTARFHCPSPCDLDDVEVVPWVRIGTGNSGIVRT